VSVIPRNEIDFLLCFSSVHPRFKQDVAYRLSRSGLAIAYGQQVEFQGPIVQNVGYSSGSATVNITYTAVSNIELRNPNGFEVYT
jgi:sialate O-acetylesterase